MKAKTPVAKSVERIAVRVAGYPVTPGVSAAFYQAEEEALSVPVYYETGRTAFFSALDSDSLSLQCDRSGRLSFIHVRKPRRLWVGEHGIAAAPSPAADIRFLDFRCRIPEPEFLCSPRRDKLLIRFGPVHSADSFQIGDNVFCYLAERAKLRGLYIDTIREDRAGAALAAWRRLILETPEHNR
ncbi:MAG TPA: hypothetical protein VLB27_02005 [candidate division Zixibacteria bacterium]|nr:hypothetical protein [candidate division Zixibacteria bacterium]